MNHIPSEFLGPLPWKQRPQPMSAYDIQDAHSRLVANCGGWQDSHNPAQHAVKLANAAYIVQAVNSHEALLAACKAVEASNLVPSYFKSMLQEAIALAQKEA